MSTGVGGRARIGVGKGGWLAELARRLVARRLVALSLKAAPGSGSFGEELFEMRILATVLKDVILSTKAEPFEQRGLSIDPAIPGTIFMVVYSRGDLDSSYCTSLWHWSRDSLACVTRPRIWETASRGTSNIRRPLSDQFSPS